MAIRINFLTELDNRGLKKAQREIAAVGKSITRTFDVAIAGAAAGVGVVLQQSAKAAIEDGKSMALLERQLKNTVGASDAQIASVEDAISKMELQASVADDVIRPAFASLVRATGDVGKATALTTLALDVAAGTGKDLSAVSMALGKAVNGSSTSLVKLVPSIKGASDPMAELQKQFKGAAETAANADPYQRLQTIFGRIQEQIGTAIVPALQEFATYLASTEGQAQLAKLVDGFKAIGTAVVDGIKYLIENRDLIFKIGSGALVIYGLAKAFEALSIIVKIAQVTFAVFSGSLTATPWGAIALGIGVVVGALSNLAIEAHKSYLEIEGVKEAADLMAEGAINPTAARGRAAQGGAYATRNTQAVKDRIAANKKAAAETAKLNAQQKELYEAMKMPSTQFDITKSLAEIDAQTKKVTTSTKANTDALKANKAAQEANSQARIKYWKNLVKEREALQEVAAKEAERISNLNDGWAKYYSDVTDVTKSITDDFTQKMDNVRQTFADFEKQALSSRDAVLKTLGAFRNLSAENNMGQFEQEVVSAFDGVKASLDDALANGTLTDAAYRNLLNYAKLESDVLQGIGKQRDELAKKRSLVAALMGDVKSAIVGFANITKGIESSSETITETSSQMVNGIKVTMSRTFEVTKQANSVADNFRIMVDKARKFTGLLKQLKASGLNADLFKQIVDAGVEGGMATAEGILSGGPEAIREVNGLFTDLQSISQDAAETTAVVMYNNGVDVVGGFLNALVNSETVLADQARSMARVFSDTFATELNTAFTSAIESARITMENEIVALTKALADALAQALDQIKKPVQAVSKSDMTESAYNAAIDASFANAADLGMTINAPGSGFGLGRGLLETGPFPASTSSNTTNVNVVVNAGLGTDGKKVGATILEQVLAYKRANGGSL